MNNTNISFNNQGRLERASKVGPGRDMAKLRLKRLAPRQRAVQGSQSVVITM